MTSPRDELFNYWNFKLLSPLDEQLVKQQNLGLERQLWNFWYFEFWKNLTEQLEQGL